ncbi:MAG: rod shape-determining protein MreD [Candidatus Aminicenantes bacterium]|nr:rod shape-determining protein MreD [Candidatus Aminicenantes bacterium]
MNRRIKFFLFIFLVVAQIAINLYTNVLKVNIDLLFLILVYIAVKSSFLKSILSAAAIGLVTDFFSGSFPGVFGFSRTISAYLISEISKYLDLRKNIFIFLLVALSLFISNFIANIFFLIILGYKISLNLILYPPLLSGLTGIILLNLPKMKQKLDVY